MTGVPPPTTLPGIEESPENPPRAFQHPWGMPQAAPPATGRPQHEHETEAFIKKMVQALNDKARLEDLQWAQHMQTQQGIMEVEQAQEQQAVAEQQQATAQQLLSAILLSSDKRIPESAELEDMIAREMTRQPPEVAAALQSFQQDVPEIQREMAQFQQGIYGVFRRDAEREQALRNAPLFKPSLSALDPRELIKWFKGESNPGSQIGAALNEMGRGAVSGITGGAVMGDISRRGGILKQVEAVVQDRLQKHTSGEKEIPGLTPQVAELFLHRAAKRTVDEMMGFVSEGPAREIAQGTGSMIGMLPFFSVASKVGSMAFRGIAKLIPNAVKMLSGPMTPQNMAFRQVISNVLEHHLAPMPLLFAYGHEMTELSEGQKLALETANPEERDQLEEAFRLHNGAGMSLVLPFFHFAGKLGDVVGKGAGSLLTRAGVGGAAASRIGGAVGGLATGAIFPEAGGIGEEVLQKLAEDLDYQAYLKATAAEGRVQAPILRIIRGMSEGKSAEEMWDDLEAYAVAATGGANVLAVFGFARGMNIPFRSRVGLDRRVTEALKDIDALEVDPEVKATLKEAVEAERDVMAPTPEAEAQTEKLAELERETGGPEEAEKAVLEQVRAEEVPAEPGTEPRVAARREALERRLEDVRAKEPSEESLREQKALEAEAEGTRLFEAGKSDRDEARAQALFDWAERIRQGEDVPRPGAEEIQAAQERGPARQAAREAKVAAEAPKRVEAELKMRKAAKLRKVQESIPPHHKTLEEYAGPEPEKVPLKEQIFNPAGYKARQEWERKMGAHALLVGDAIAAGKDVPMEVVKAYPHLIPQAQAQLAARGKVGKAAELGDTLAPIRQIRLLPQASRGLQHSLGGLSDADFAKAASRIERFPGSPKSRQGQKAADLAARIRSGDRNFTASEAAAIKEVLARAAPGESTRPQKPQEVTRPRQLELDLAGESDADVAEIVPDAVSETTKRLTGPDKPAESASPRPTTGAFAPSGDHLAAKVGEVMELAAADLVPHVQAVTKAKTKADIETMAEEAKDPLHKQYYEIAAELPYRGARRAAEALYHTLKGWWPLAKDDFRSLQEITEDIAASFEAVSGLIAETKNVLMWDRWAGDLHQEFHGPWVVAARQTEMGRKLIADIDAYQRPFYPVTGPLAIFLNPDTYLNRGLRSLWNFLQGRKLKRIDIYAGTESRSVIETQSTTAKKVERSLIGGFLSKYLGTGVGRVGELAHDAARALSEMEHDRERHRHLFFAPFRGFFSRPELRGKVGSPSFWRFFQRESPVETRKWRKARETIERVEGALSKLSPNDPKRGGLEKELAEANKNLDAAREGQLAWWMKILGLYIEARNPARMEKWPQQWKDFWNALPDETRNDPKIRKIADEFESITEPYRKQTAETSSKAVSWQRFIDDLAFGTAKLREDLALDEQRLREAEANFQTHFSDEMRQLAEIKAEEKRLKKLLKKGQASERDLAILREERLRIGGEIDTRMEQLGLRDMPDVLKRVVERKKQAIGRAEARRLDEIEARKQWVEGAYTDSGPGWLHHVSAVDWRKHDTMDVADMYAAFQGDRPAEDFAQAFGIKTVQRAGPTLQREHKLGLRRDPDARRAMQHYFQKVLPAYYMNRFFQKWHPILFGHSRLATFDELVNPWKFSSGDPMIRHKNGNYTSLGEFYEFEDVAKDPQTGKYTRKVSMYLPTNRNQNGPQLEGSAAQVVKRTEKTRRAGMLGDVRPRPKVAKKVILKSTAMTAGEARPWDPKWIENNKQHLVIAPRERLQRTAFGREAGLVQKLKGVNPKGYLEVQEVITNLFHEASRLMGLETIEKAERSLNFVAKLVTAHYIGWLAVPSAVNAATGALALNAHALGFDTAAKDLYMPFLYAAVLRKAGLDGSWRDIPKYESLPITAEKPFMTPIEAKIRRTASKWGHVTAVTGGRAEHFADAAVALYNSGMLQGHRGSSFAARRSIRPGQKIKPNPVAGVFDAAFNTGMFAFDLGETFVREHLFLSSYMTQRAAGRSHAMAEAQSTKLVHAFQGVFNRASKSRFTQRPVGRTLTSLFSWAMKITGTFWRTPMPEKIRWAVTMAALYEAMQLLLDTDMGETLGTPTDEIFGGVPGLSDLAKRGTAISQGVGISTDEDPLGEEKKPLIRGRAGRIREEILTAIRESGAPDVPKEVTARIVGAMMGDLTQLPNGTILPIDPFGVDTPVVSMLSAGIKWLDAIARGSEVDQEHAQAQFTNRLTPSVLKWIRRAWDTEEQDNQVYAYRPLSLDDLKTLFQGKPEGQILQFLEEQGWAQMLEDMIPGTPLRESMTWNAMAEGRERTRIRSDFSRDIHATGVSLAARWLNTMDDKAAGEDVRVEQAAILEERKALLERARAGEMNLDTNEVWLEWMKKGRVWREADPRMQFVLSVPTNAQKREEMARLLEDEKYNISREKFMFLLQNVVPGATGPKPLQAFETWFLGEGIPLATRLRYQKAYAAAQQRWSGGGR